MDNLAIPTMDSSKEEDEACLFAMQLGSAAVLPLALRSAIELDLLELMKKSGPCTFVSPAQLADQIPNTNTEAHIMIDRILYLLATYSVLNCSMKTLPDGGVERLYSLAPVCKYLTKNDDGVSMVPVVIQNLDEIAMGSWRHVKDAVIGGGVPFNRAHGMNVFEYNGTDPRFSNIFNLSMSNKSTLVMKKILESYNGFEGLESVVDVGGGIGSTLDMIVSKYPSIKGINFDLAHVIEKAPSYPGVKHVDGDMFVRIPKGDAIFLKRVCHDWTDEECVKLLKNCYEALPDNGKVIVSDCILPDAPNTGLPSKLTAHLDVLMMVICQGGKERTEKEFEALAKRAGFKKFVKVCCAYYYWIMELWK